ncbi:MAG: hypothetical protein U0793_23810 [Gemmataceae bacterium]
MFQPRTLLLAVFALCASAAPLSAQGKAPVPNWIWHGEPRDNQTVYFRKEIAIKGRVNAARLAGACDNKMTVYLNGKEVLTSDNWETPVSKDVSDILAGTKDDSAVLAVEAYNSEGPAGLVLQLVLDGPKKEKTTIVTDGSWLASEKAAKGWNDKGFDASSWSKAIGLGKIGAASVTPWNAVTLASLTRGTAAGAKLKKITATPSELIKVKKDFKVELLYTVPRDKQGSWVSLTVDDKGRLITSDQYGKLYRVTPPALGGKAEDTKVEELPVDLGEAQGLLWHNDTLYVVVNRGKKYASGLWAVTSSKKDDTLDTKILLHALGSGGEHGPHGVVLGPDGKSLYICCGNHTGMTKINSSLVPEKWGEDFLVPRLWDASGHAVGIMAPGGCTYKVSLDGKNWTLVSMGYRNHYDIAFNRDGELFTYDSDMEWDMSLPWYRPTRVCHAVPGSEFGWRGGTGKMYEYHPDNLPPAVNVGPGSPTGVVFGYGAKFPAKYQDALFLCDWSYGKLYAGHLTPDGASYKCELEEFMNGSPLPLTDIVVNPKDGAIYFTIGGRSTLSGLYRLTYTGSEDTSPAKKTVEKEDTVKARAIRHKLESYYGKKDAKAVEEAWPYLSNPDRFLRWAARTVLEFQDPKTWAEKALKETDPVALTHAVIGLARGDKSLQPRDLESGTERVDWKKLTPAEDRLPPGLQADVHPSRRSGRRLEGTR